MLAVGIDSVSIDRIRPWIHYQHTTLRRIFTQEELDYCFAVPAKTAERLAVRFAAREAFFKALHGAFPNIQVPLLTVMRSVCIKQHPNGAPFLQIDWPHLQPYLACYDPSKIQVTISLTHTHETASAIVILADTKEIRVTF